MAEVSFLIAKTVVCKRSLIETKDKNNFCNFEDAVNIQRNVIKQMYSCILATLHILRIFIHIPVKVQRFGINCFVFVFAVAFLFTSAFVAT